MSRPIGVTVIAVALAAVGFVSQIFVGTDQDRDPLLLGATALFLVVVSVALFGLQNWARWTCIVLYIISLVRLPVRVFFAGGSAGIAGVVLQAIFVGWAVWYLFRPHVAASFGEG